MAPQASVPFFQGVDLKVLEKPSLNFDGLQPAFDRVWYGAVRFEVAGEEFVLEDFLNYGAEGQTYSATRSSDGKRFVTKFCNVEDSREVALLKNWSPALLTHPNFITYEKVVCGVRGQLAPAHHIIIMEHIPNGELLDLLMSEEPSVAGKPVSEGTIRRFLHDVITGMAQCYRSGITHRDLKPENLLINEHGRLIIIDLGHAKCGQPCLHRSISGDAPAPPPLVRHTTVNPYGSLAFNAPEVASGVKYDCELADVWSLGIIAFYLHAKLPALAVCGGPGTFADFTGDHNGPFWDNVNSNRYYPAFPESLTKFINVLLRTEPGKRPSFRELDLAVKGDLATLEQFPGLQWLNQPVNSSTAFLNELRRSCPSKTFN